MFIRPLSCYTLFSGFRLPWPPCGCLDELTPFVVSDNCIFRHLNSAFGSSHIASSAYQKWPTKDFYSCTSSIKKQSFAPIPRFYDRFARQNRYELPSEFPLTSPYPGIVHHLSGPNILALTQYLHINDPDWLILLGPCFKTGRLKLFHQHPYIVSKSQAITQLIKIATFSKPFSDTHRLMLTCLSSEYTPCEADPTNTILTSNVSLSAISRTVNSIFKVLVIFPSRYLFAIGLSLIFSLRWNLPPTLSCIPKQLDS
ncbi:hypothetical protein MELLADRAFT_84215 [Melampsora larici-populina 98AG31]|uniref:Uncharacterized protein n=1 Tax=Melampsora larici-populina (strain 98AG31 / pathotype 3-4-7) TaxID=747676 RepID=F4SBZ8_MELLP|nr:hypothetical protein MELLADRAFT_84215 [Melampsora larici-populina 98AG31]